MPLVSIERARIVIQGHRILDALELAIFRGEHVGIVGANGSGKSTLLRLIEGTLWPAPGSGRRIYDFGNGPESDAIGARRRIVLVGPELQNRYTRFGWNFRAVDVVRSGITKSDIPRRAAPPAETARALELLTWLGLADLADSRFLTLSRGQQRRVLIARALGFEPTLLLLDEPTSGLDAAARDTLDALLTRAAEHTTIVVTAHAADDLPSLTTEVVVVTDGRLVAAGPRATLKPARNTNGGAGPTPRPAAQTASPTIDVRNASVYHDGRAVLRAVDWRLVPGEHWLIRGANGSGKTTFLKLLHGQLRPAADGSIAWPGLGNPPDVWTLRRRVALVSAELIAAYRYPVTVRECIGSGIDSSFGLTRRLTEPETGRVEALLARFELDALASRPLPTLSYGQLHRAMIARTLINDPDVLLLDEPWEGLDPATRTLVARIVEGTKAAGTQIVCASHIDEDGLSFNRFATVAAGSINDGYAATAPRENSGSAHSRAEGSQ